MRRPVGISLRDCPLKSMTKCDKESFVVAVEGSLKSHRYELQHRCTHVSSFRPGKSNRAATTASLERFGVLQIMVFASAARAFGLLRANGR